MVLKLLLISAVETLRCHELVTRVSSTDQKIRRPWSANAIFEEPTNESNQIPPCELPLVEWRYLRLSSLKTGAANLPMPHSNGNGSAIWLTARKAASFPALMGILLGGVSVVGIRLRTPDPDTWWHIAVGQRILDTHSWPTSDPYSFTASGVHWIAYEWLGEVAMALATRVGGLLGLAGLQICLAAIATMLLYYYAYVRCGNWKASCVATGLLLPFASVIFALRPQLFGYIFLLVTLICLEQFRQGHPNALWVLPPLFLIWVNTHGTFVFGLAAIGVYFAGGLVKFQLGGLSAEPWTGRQRTQLLFTFLLCCLAILSRRMEPNSPLIPC